MRVLAPEYRIDPNHGTLELQSVQIVSHTHQICFWRKAVIRVIPISAGKHRQLPGIQNLLYRVPNFGEAFQVIAPPFRTDRVGELQRFSWICFRGIGDINEVQSVQVIEVDHVILDFLRS